MIRTTKLMLGGVVIAAIAAGGVAASAHRGGWGHGGPGGHGMMGGPMGAICEGKGAEMTDHMLIGLQYKVNPTDAQKPAFEELKAAAKVAAAKAQAGCPAKPAQTADGTQPPRKAPTERLALMETALAAQLDAIRTVRPAAEKFYASLSDEQKKTMTEMGPRGHGNSMHRGGGDDEGRGGERGHRGWNRGPGGERGHDAPGAALAPEKK